MSSLVVFLLSALALGCLIQPKGVDAHASNRHCLQTTRLYRLLFQIETLEKIICRECPSCSRTSKYFTVLQQLRRPLRINESIDLKLATATVVYLKGVYKKCKRGCRRPPPRIQLIKRSVDLAFLIDTSVTPKQLQLMKSVMSSFEANCLRTLKKAVRVSVIVYGRYPKALKWFSTKTKLNKKIMVSKGNRFSLKNGIRYVRQYAFQRRYGHRRGARKMVVVIGNAKNLDKASTVKEANKARNSTNIEFFYLALAERREKVDTQLLNGVAPRRGRYMYSVIRTYRKWTHKALVSKICREVKYQDRVFRFTAVAGPGKLLSLNQAASACKELGLAVASTAEIHREWRRSRLESCTCGWASNGKGYLPIQRRGACGYTKTGKILGQGPRWCRQARGKGYDVFCSAVLKTSARNVS
ncbi:uncharacterized protein LOC135496912 [Lineus longissimus]|uniref:uncharacterized protein LOC135496912 n=1 Tax=Lineus longissimus TaxID=88925 RepID=UPI00315CDA30